MGVAGFEAVVKSTRLPALTHLSVGTNQLGVGGTAALARSAIDFSKLTYLDLRMNEFGDQGARAIARAMNRTGSSSTSSTRDSDGFDLHQKTASLPSLEYLDLSDNEFEAEGVEVLAEAIDLSGLEFINMNACKLDKEDNDSLAKIANVPSSFFFKFSTTRPSTAKLFFQGTLDHGCFRHR